MAESTQRKIRWAVDLFKEWVTQRNKNAVEDTSLNISPILVELEDMTKDEINYSLSRFVCEIKKKNGNDFPGETLHEIIICIQLFFEQRNQCYKFLSDPEFMQLRNTLDTMMQEKKKAGIGIRRKQAQVIDIDEEKLMWEKNVLGSDSPSKLVNTLVYLIGLNFALRGGQEHRNLRWKNSQLQLMNAKDGKCFLRYTEDVSKNNQGGLKHRKIKPKVVDAYENENDRTRCIVTLFKKYVAHCPPEGSRPDCFYLRPLAKPKGTIWFASQPIGRHKLAKVVEDLCKEAGLGGYRTNHSLRASAATRLYDQHVDEQLITEVTGHRSNAVRNYKRSSENLKRHVNSIVQGVPEDKNPKKVGTSTSSNGILVQEVRDGEQTKAKSICLTLNLNI